MKLIGVIPVSRGISKETLTYFTAGSPEVGSIMKVPLRGRSIHALVIEVEDLTQKKTDLKTLSFSIKKAEGIVTSRLFSKEYIDAAGRAAEYFASTTGSILNSLVPRLVLENASTLKTDGSPRRHHKHHKLVVQADDVERFAHYKSIIREEFARKSSVFLCVPTATDARRVISALEKGIEPYSFIFHPQTKKKDLVESWQKLLLETHPVLIVATAGFLCVPRGDIGTIILERECSRAYRSQSRPFVDLRVFAELFAEEYGARLLLGDTLLRTETVSRYKNDEISELTPLKFRSTTGADQTLVDMRDIEKKKGGFCVFSPALEELILRSKENNGHLFLFASRRGLSPLTICGDCGTIVECRKCRAPITLHTFGKERFFLCHRCGDRRSAEERCRNCSGWKLTTYGIGVELVFEEFKKKFPDVQIMRIDADCTKTYVQASAVSSRFLETPGSVLLGTEMALSYLDGSVDSSAVVSLDSMLGIPDFRINEKILYILLKVRALAQKRFLIQTRSGDNPIFALAMSGNLIDFYKNEIKERRTFDYPPFTILIKISLSGKESAVREEMEKLAEDFLDYSVQTYPAFVRNLKGKFLMHTLIKIGQDRWVEPTLLSKLLALPPQFAISVDPESIL